MPYRDMPWVREGRLLNGSDLTIAVDSPAWFEWLDEASHFSYMASQSSFRMTVRKEKRRHQLYWYTYLKEAGKLHNAYLGRSQALTALQLEKTIQQLVEKARRHRSQTGKNSQSGHS